MITSVNLAGQPPRFLGAYITALQNQLGLEQAPSTCNVTVVEDTSNGVVFTEPEVGSYQTVELGSNFRFDGVVTSWTRDIANIGGRQIRVNLADPREIMRGVPIILAPGFRNVVAGIAGTECSVIDAFGAYDDYETTGINLSGWNQAGMEYYKIAWAMRGGVIQAATGIYMNVEGQVANAFGETYRFLLDNLSAYVDPSFRINSNLISVADFIQEVATRHSLDWRVTSSRNEVDNYIDVVVHVIDRSTDNVDLDLDTFLAAHSGRVSEATRGYELRNDVACSVLLGAQVEQISRVNILGLANNPIDLSDAGGSSAYFMTEEEMRWIMGSKESWRLWISLNGGLDRYSVGGIQQATAAPIITPTDFSDILRQTAINPNRTLVSTESEDVAFGIIYERLRGHAEASYGKRFLYARPFDVDIADAAWTADVIAGNNDPNEYFRNEQGRTRCYVEFTPTDSLVANPQQGVLGFAGQFALGKGANAAQALSMELRNSFNKVDALVESDKADWIIREDSLFIAATIEEGGIVRIDTPVIFANPSTDEVLEAVKQLRPVVEDVNADGTTSSKAKRAQLILMHIHGEYPAFGKVHAKCYQPRYCYLPVRSKYTRYGPVFSTTLADAQGRLNIEQDDGFAPWEFGSASLMLDAMQFKVDNEASNVKQVETANITVEGYPAFSIGAALGFNSNINSIGVNFGIGGVTTTYELRSFLRKFGELSKQELATLSLFARRSGARTLPQDIVAFIQQYRPVISRQFAGRGAASTYGTAGGATSID